MFPRSANAVTRKLFITHHFIRKTNTEKSKVTFNRGARAREKRAHTRTKHMRRAYFLFYLDK